MSNCRVVQSADAEHLSKHYHYLFYNVVLDVLSMVLWCVGHAKPQFEAIRRMISPSCDSA